MALRTATRKGDAKGRGVWVGVALLAAAPALAQRGAECGAARTALPVTLPVTIRGNHFVLTACHGDRPLTFILDTGAGATLLDFRTAQALGIPALDAFTSGGAGAGRVQGAHLRRDSVRLAGTDVEAAVTQALDLQGISERGGIHVDGILGADFIERFVLGLSYHDSTMQVIAPKAFRYTGSGTQVPFTFRGRFIFVDGTLGLSDGTRVPGTFVVDVGAGGSLSLAKPYVEANHLHERVGSTVHRLAGFGVGGPTMGDFGRASSLSIGSVTLARPTVTLYGDSAGVFSSNGLGDGNIGGDILRRFTLFLDYASRLLIFEPNADYREPFEVDMTGLSMLPLPGQDKARVEFVVPSSPAASAGFVVGDTVVALDGRPASSAEIDVTSIRRRREGEHLTYTVRRGGVDVVLALVTKRLI